MRNFILLLCLFLSTAGRAQYFENYYEPNVMGSGITTRYVSDGHLLAGIHSGDLAVIYTDISGGFSGSNFKKAYHLTYNSYDAVVTGAEALEYTDSSGFGVVASFYTNQGDNGLFFLKLASNGSVTTTACYTFDDPIIVKAIRESTSNPGDIFATGDVPTTKIFAMRIDQAGNLNWGYVYSTEYGWSPGTGDPTPPSNPETVEANDIMQSPYQDNGVYPLTVVGGIISPTTSTSYINQNGLIYAIDPANGAGLPYTVYINVGSNNDEELFTGMDESSDGLVVCGKAQDLGGSSYHNWITLFEPRIGATWPNNIWTKKYKSPYFATTNNETKLVDIFWRSSNNEYYAIGNDWQSNQNLITMVKVDNNGAVLTGREYLRDDNFYPVSIDQNLAGTADGVGLYNYGNNDVTLTYDMNILKTYYNGVYDCNSNTYSPTASAVSLSYYTMDAFGEELEESSITVDNTYDLDYTPNCYAETVQGGSNSFTRLNETGLILSPDDVIYPNPVSVGNEISINLVNNTNEPVQIRVFDGLGREVMEQSFKAESDVIQLNTAKLSRGVYYIQMKQGSSTSASSLLIQ